MLYTTPIHGSVLLYGAAPFRTGKTTHTAGARISTHTEAVATARTSSCFVAY